MAVDECCGLSDRDGLLTRLAREGWTRWCRDDASLAVVDDLVDLREWIASAPPSARGAILAAVAIRTKDDQAAVAVLVWLLLPGAHQVAQQLRDLSPDVDALVAGQLWIEAAAAWRLLGPGVAKSILRRTRGEVCADLGVGDGARRRDRAWATAVRVERFDETLPAVAGEVEEDSFWQVTELMMEAMDDHVVGVFDAWLIEELSRVAHYTGAPGRRGRQGLTTPAVVAIVAEQVRLSPRGLRRRAGKALDRLGEYVAVRDDPAQFAVWKAQHPAGSLTARDQMDLVISEGESAYWVRARPRAADGLAAGEPSSPRHSATG